MNPRTSLLPLLVLASLVVAQPVAAGPLVVTSVHWVPSNVEIPHEAVNGRRTVLKAIAEGGETCEGSYTYRWDANGDGDYDDEGEGETPANTSGRAGLFAVLEGRITFPDAANDRLHYPTVEVTCGEEVVTATYPVEARVDGICSRYRQGNEGNWCDGGENLDLTRRVWANAAISDSLWYLFKRFTHRATDVEGRDVHLCWLAESYPAVSTASAYLAATRRSHRLGPGSEGDPYFRHLSECALHAVVDHLTPVDLSATLNFGQPVDADENGLGVHCSRDGAYNSCRSYNSSYIGGPVLEVLANFGDPDYVVPTGVEEGVFGRTLSELSQDFTDYLASCLGTSDDGASGVWHYSCGAGGRDTSTHGWPAEALRIVEDKNGNIVPDWLKDLNEQYVRRYCGTFGCVYGAQWTLAGNGLTTWGMVTNQVFDYDDGDMVSNLTGVQNFINQSLGEYYAMYASTKGLRAFVPEIRLLPDGRNWNNLYVDYLVGAQQADGSFGEDSSSIRNSGGVGMQAGLGVQILESWLDTQPRARAYPTRVAPGDIVNFDHSWSYPLDPDHPIVVYRWNVMDDVEDDLDEDGVVTPDEMAFEFQTEDAAERYQFRYDDDLTWGEVTNHRVTLEVEDDRGRRNWDSDSVRVEVSFINHGPVVVPHPQGQGGVYRTHAGFSVMLDASESFEPDQQRGLVFPGDAAIDPECDPCRPEGIGDHITAIAWDLDLDGVYEAESALVEYTAPPGVIEGNRIAVPIIVCDDGQWNGECYDDLENGLDCSLCTTGVATVNVIPNTNPVASAGGPYAGREGDVLTLDASASVDPEALPMRYLWDLDGDEEFDDAEGHQVRHTLGAGPDQYAISVRVIDHGDKWSEARTTVTVANAPPAPPRVRIGPRPFDPDEDPDNPDPEDDPPPPAQEGSPYPIQVDGDDPGGDDVMYYVDCDGDGEPDWSGREGPAECTFPDNGEYEVSVWAEDSDGDESERTTVTVRVENVDPVPTFADVRYLDEGEELVVAADALDPGLRPTEGFTFTWNWGDGATGEGDIGRHTYKDNGDFEVTLTATDKDGGSGQLRFRAIVSNVAPSIESVPPMEGVVTKLWRYLPRIWDAGSDDTHVVELLISPDGMQIEAETGAIEWTPGADGRGHFDVVIEVKDDDNGWARQSWVLTIVGPRGEAPGAELLPDLEDLVTRAAEAAEAAEAKKGGAPAESSCAVAPVGGAASWDGAWALVGLLLLGRRRP
jgi:hypothetical protein